MFFYFDFLCTEWLVYKRVELSCLVLLRISKIRASQLKRWLEARAVSVLSDVKESICALSCSIDVLVSRQRLFQYCIYTYNKHTHTRVFPEKKKIMN